ncbi:hypothetical protein [Candidatus Amarolinea dominans]|uniref:hypothetical protein n=1 Tax=Candidatus Amarolinea dominans TaxID=3140696 RepID=UPI001DBB78C4|nr:hypothetical protein [Anaerolineae bacterium]
MDRKHIRFDLGLSPWPRLVMESRRHAPILPTPGNVLFNLLMIGLSMRLSSAGAAAAPWAGNVPSTTTYRSPGPPGPTPAARPDRRLHSIIFRLHNVASGGVPL